jgi:hypothetical protein
MKTAKFLLISLFILFVVSAEAGQIQKKNLINLTNGVANLVINTEVYSSELVIKINALINETVANLRSIGFVKGKSVGRPPILIEVKQVKDEVIRVSVDNTVSTPIEKETTIDGTPFSYEFKCSVYNLSREIIGKIFFLEVKKGES